MQLRKIHTAFVFLALPLLLPLLLLFALQAAQLFLQASREQRLVAHPTVKLKLAIADVVWEKAGKELRIGNRLFDVSNYRQTGDTLHVQGFFDEAEDDILAFLHHLLPTKTQTGLLHWLLLLQCFVALTGLLQFGINGFVRRMQIRYQQPSFPSPFLALNAPPPWL